MPKKKKKRKKNKKYPSKVILDMIVSCRSDIIDDKAYDRKKEKLIEPDE